MNLLASAEQEIVLLGQTYEISLNWLGKLIKGLIGGFGSVGIGIIVFSLILRVVVLPFDVYQRISMRKQNVKMQENSEKMEKLQKQYANDKEMYNKKLMEMYKENGISMVSSCLPTILSLVIFIVAINAFNAYSTYANVDNYNLMVNAYNAYVTDQAPDYTKAVITEDGNKLVIKEDGKVIYYKVDKNADAADNAYIESAEKTYYVGVDALYTNNSDAAVKTEIDGIRESKKEVTEKEDGTTEEKEYPLEAACADYIRSLAQDSVAKEYRATISDRTSFAWVKNIWTTDATFKHPIVNYSDLQLDTKAGCSCGIFSSTKYFDVDGKEIECADIQIKTGTNAYTSETYSIITAKLTKEKSQANGFYIMILLSIGTILLQQFVTMKSQKAQSKFSTVDGQGAGQQKMMMVMMTFMFAIFSFMYSTAFSIYLVTSNVVSLVSTLVINKMVDSHLEKKEAAAVQAKYNQRFPGRVNPDDKKNNKNSNSKKNNGSKKK